MLLFFFFKQKTAYEMRISDWSSDVCSSDLHCVAEEGHIHSEPAEMDDRDHDIDERGAPQAEGPLDEHIGGEPGAHADHRGQAGAGAQDQADRKSTRLNSSH